MGAALPRAGTREDADPLAETREEVGGRRGRRAGKASPLPAAAAELSRDSRARRSGMLVSSDFGPYGLGKEQRIGMEFGSDSWN
jgi:hypothetical protein